MFLSPSFSEKTYAQISKDVNNICEFHITNTWQLKVICNRRTVPSHIALWYWLLDLQSLFILFILPGIILYLLSHSIQGLRMAIIAMKARMVRMALMAMVTMMAMMAM